MRNANNDTWRNAVNQARLIANSLRSSIMGKFGIDRTIKTLWEAFGYKTNLTYDDFALAYKRQGIAKRIINANVDYTWKDFPIIIDEKEEANQTVRGTLDTPIANYARTKHKMTNNLTTEANENMPNFTLFEESIYAFMAKFPLLEIVKKADILNCIGRYSVIVIGTCVDDEMNEDLNNLQNPLPTGLGVDDIAFLKVYSEKQAIISQWETNTNNPRYGLPLKYRITVEKGQGLTAQYIVDYTRIIHIAEDLIDSDVYGTPKLEAVYNDLQDLLKVVGGSAEMYWLGAYQGLVFNVKDGFNITPEIMDKMKADIEQYENKLQRHMRTAGIEVSTIQSETSDPAGNFDVSIKLISGASDIPTRILIGSEQGQLAASVDRDNFFSMITSRRNSFANESILRPLINRLVKFGYLYPANNDEYLIEWKTLYEETKNQKLTNAKLMVETATAAAPIGGDATDVITLEEVREAMGLPLSKVTSNNDNELDVDLDDLPIEDDTMDTKEKTALEIFRERRLKIASKQ